MSPLSFLNCKISKVLPREVLMASMAITLVTILTSCSTTNSFNNINSKQAGQASSRSPASLGSNDLSNFGTSCGGIPNYFPDAKANSGEVKTFLQDMFGQGKYQCVKGRCINGGWEIKRSGTIDTAPCDFM